MFKAHLFVLGTLPLISSLSATESTTIPRHASDPS